MSERKMMFSCSKCDFSGLTIVSWKDHLCNMYPEERDA